MIVRIYRLRWSIVRENSHHEGESIENALRRFKRKVMQEDIN